MGEVPLVILDNHVRALESLLHVKVLCDTHGLQLECAIDC